MSIIAWAEGSSQATVRTDDFIVLDRVRKIIAVNILTLALLLCSSRGTDLFHVTADEQLAKFQDLFRSLVSEDNKSLSKMIAYFVLGNDPDGIITYLYFTNVDQQNGNIDPVSE